MGISLNGLTPAGTYPGLIKTGDNTAISGTPKVLSDGNGNNLPMEVSTTGVNFTNQLQQGGVAVPTASQVAAKQDTLVSGTNIKTINGTSVLGSGNIVTPSTPPSGVAGAIQFSNGSAFASDASNLFWDDANNRLGVGTNTPSAVINSVSSLVGIPAMTMNGIGGSAQPVQRIVMSGTGQYLWAASMMAANMSTNNNLFYFIGKAENTNNSAYFGYNHQSDGSVNNFATLGLFGVDNVLNITAAARVGIGTTTPTARTHIQGSGSTSATTSLLVQNSAGTASLQVTDDGSVFNYGKASITSNNAFGKNALINNTTGTNNTANGFSALANNTTGSANTADGVSALASNLTGTNNTAIGRSALTFMTAGSGNTAVGTTALYSNNASNNTAVGYDAGNANTTGANNSLLGQGTITGNFSGSVILGKDATATASNQFVVGSTGTNAGSVVTESNSSTKVWNVIINGVAQKILLA